MSESSNDNQSAESLSGELYSYCRSDSLSEDGLREIIERHGLTPNNNIPNITDYDFFFWACHNERVTEGIIQYLLQYFPAAASATTEDGSSPLHFACARNSIAIVEYLYKLYPGAINHANTDGHPIHFAIDGLNKRHNPVAAVDIVQFLLDCDPNVKLQKVRERFSLLHFACQGGYNDSNIEAALQIINVIYDAHPEAIESNEILTRIQRYHQQVQTFINSQLVYSRQAKDHSLMMTPDDKGQLPLHTTLQNNVRLGSIKLLVKGNPSAIRNFDNSGTIPLHVACQHHDSASVIQYLIGLDMRTLRAVDYDNNTALHYACRGAKYETITLLLEKYDAVSVSKKTTHNKLPIDLLFESNEVFDRESVEYTESVYRLLKAYPEMLMNCNSLNKKQQAKSDGCSSQKGKKRKLGT